MLIILAIKKKNTYLYIHLDIFLIRFLTFFNILNNLLLRLFNTALPRSWLPFRDHFLTHLRLSRFSGLPSLRLYGFLSNWSPSNGSCSSSSASTSSSCRAFDSSFVWTFCYLSTFSITSFTSCRASTSATSASCWLRFWLSTFTCSTWNLNFNVIFKFSLTFNWLIIRRRLALNDFLAHRCFRLIFGLYFFFLLLRGLLIIVWFLFLRWNFFFLRSGLWIVLFIFNGWYLIRLRSILILLIIFNGRILFLLRSIWRFLFLLRTILTFLFVIRSILFLLSKFDLRWFNDLFV